MTQAFNLSQFANKVNTSGQADLTTAVTGTLPVANGGTGATSITANGVVIGNGTSAVTTVAPSTSGNVLTSNGTSWVSSAPSGGGGGRGAVAFYDSATGTGMVWNSNGSATFTVPSGVTTIKVTVVGGGGAGGSATGGTTCGGGGGGGGIAIEWLTGLTGGSTVSVTIGAAGGTSSFGAYCSATGGSAGASDSSGAYGAKGAGGAGGTGSGGSINLSGEKGGRGAITLASTAPSGLYAGGCGGSTPFGFGAPTNNVTATTVGESGSGYGAGGSGGCRTATQGTTAGGAGTSGIVIVEW